MKRASNSAQAVRKASRVKPAARADLADGAKLKRRLQQTLRQCRRSGQPFAVLSLELNGSEQIEPAWDARSRAIAGCIGRVLRKGDFLARPGLREYVALLPGLQGAQAGEQLAARVLEAVTGGPHCGEAAVPLTVSIGITFYPQAEVADGKQLLHQARKAVQRAKQAGKNRFCIFDPVLDGLGPSRRDCVERIAKALAANEFAMYYQPKVNMSTGTVIGAEALIRWQHPERGLLLPAQFLPLIEDDALALTLGEWTIDEVLTQMERWLSKKLELAVSVNIGAPVLQQYDFADRVRALLSKHRKIKPSSLELEIKGMSALNDLPRLSKVLEECRRMGVSVAIDDFGAGHASLSDIKQLPANILKIDASFVRDIVSDSKDMSILEGVLSAAASFKGQSVAMGVENVDQGMLLLRLGCELAQGYGIAPPMRARELPGWISLWRPDPRWADAFSIAIAENLFSTIATEHRSWIEAVEAFVKAKSTTEPQQSIHDCRLGVWLEEECRMERSAQPILDAVAILHLRLHAMSKVVLDQHAQGNIKASKAALDELKSLEDRLLRRLRKANAGSQKIRRAAA
ncbi:MAG: EAL domain-containing protein [Terracidiphilus sp.]|jgi:diguanylate cyclase (GGDEF)-like protein